jgi:effector-binding domain-containing protein
MIDTPQITTFTPKPIAVIHVVTPASEIQNVMGPGLNELTAAVAAQGITPSGPWFTHHFKMPSDVFDFEIGLPVPQAVTATGRMTPSQLPAIKVARTVYHGGYEGLGEGWGQFMSWIEANGLNSAPELWETYTVGPETDPDPANWRTELSRPLLD